MAKWKMHRYSIIILEVSSAKLIAMILQIKLEMFNQNQIVATSFPENMTSWHFEAHWKG